MAWIIDISKWLLIFSRPDNSVKIMKENVLILRDTYLSMLGWCVLSATLGWFSKKNYILQTFTKGNAYMANVNCWIVESGY